MDDNDASAKVLLQTTMEFVVHVLERVFGKTRDETLRLVLAIHRDGRGECGSYSRKRAARIAERVPVLARRMGRSASLHRRAEPVNFG
jgi:ATP-dependent Clp protease adaptor protein ClpS